MSTGMVGKKVYEDFSVTDENNDLVDGISVNTFMADLFDPDGLEVSASMSVSMVELGNGHYRIEFTPNKSGAWYLVVYHTQYFPWGKANDIIVYTSDFSSLGDTIARIIGLVQENHYLDNTVYTNYQGIKLLTSGRMRIYSNKNSVGTGNDVLGTYIVTSEWSGDELQTYKVVRQ